MALTAFIISSLLFYGTSKYFPLRNHKSAVWLSTNKMLGNALGVMLSVIALVALMAGKFDSITALVVGAFTFTMVLSALILTTKLNTKWLYFWTATAFLSLVIEII